MISGQSKRTYQAQPQRVWELITATTDISWRPSVSAASSTGPSSYSETNRRTGYTTDFTVTNEVPNVRRDMSVTHVDGSGTSSYLLTAHPDGSTTFEIIQQFDFTGPRLIRPLVARFLKSERQTFLSDLGKALS